MFNTNTLVSNKTSNVIVKIPKQAPDVTKLEINKREAGSIFVNCRKGDNVWMGLFYRHPFLNRADETRGSFRPVGFDNPERLEMYEPARWLDAETNAANRKRHDENIRQILRIQAVDVIQLRFISETEVIAEVKYINPAGSNPDEG